MRFYPECYQCTLNQLLKISKLTGLGERDQIIVVKKMLKILCNASDNITPPEMAGIAYDIIKKIYNNGNNSVFDPYSKIKEESNRIALSYYDSVKSKVKKSGDILNEALKISAAGNIIDFGIFENHKFDFKKELKKYMDSPFTASDMVHFKKLISKAETLLFIGDNAGEIVFDRILIEILKQEYPGIKITYTVRETPVLNDITFNDVRETGLDKVCDVISSGSKIPGTKWDKCSDRFKYLFNTSDVIISKGQGNYETLCGVKNGKLFFLFLVKCDIIARHVGYDKESQLFICNKRG